VPKNDAQDIAQKKLSIACSASRVLRSRSWCRSESIGRSLARLNRARSARIGAVSGACVNDIARNEMHILRGFLFGACAREVDARRWRGGWRGGCGRRRNGATVRCRGRAIRAR
jgi:hypothetical protein